MAIACPHCKHGFSLKEAKPGRYRPKCSKCGQKFLLTVFPDANKPPKVELPPAEDAGATLMPESAEQNPTVSLQKRAPTVPGEAAKRAAPAKIPATKSADATLASADATLAPSDAKPEAKPETKPAAKPPTKPAAKPEAKPAAKVETKPTAKPAEKPETKPVAKLAAKPQPATLAADDTVVPDVAAKKNDVPETDATVVLAAATQPAAAKPNKPVADTNATFIPVESQPAASDRTQIPDSDATRIPAAPAAADGTMVFTSVAAAQKTQAAVDGATVVPETATKVDATVVPSAAATQVERAAPKLPAGVTSTIGGYKIVKELGRGAMGSVFLAKQISLDRDVALKTIQAQWANNPTFIARFTREAYAAAQLTHHNVVQIYDLGVDHNTNFFSMEFVRGESLDDTVKKAGKLEPAVAVGYVLQAARGLQFAHANGMVHRDIKPANLMLNQHGVVKVADLGLVKIPSAGDDGDGRPNPGETNAALAAATAEVTMAHAAMGTPAYMAPEQSEDAASVDHRADIYSLGCTLYVLLTGKPPFEGASALEVMTKHRTTPVVRPDAVVKTVPKELADITLRMVAKKREDRYPKLDDVIADLEKFLGLQAGDVEAAAPNDEHAAILEAAIAKFNKAGLAKLRSPLAMTFIAGCLGLFAILLFASPSLAGGCLGVLAMTTAFYFVLSGLRDRTYLHEKAREFVFAARWSDWLTWFGGWLLFLLALWLFGQLWIWLGAAVVAFGLAAAMHFLIDRRLAAQRAESLNQVEQLLKSLRLKGLDETTLRAFVARFSGDQWEEFFEALFGYEVKLAAREEFGRNEKGRRRGKFRAWREPLIRWIDRRVRSAKDENSRKHLQKVEAKGLEAQGLDPAQAQLEAERRAHALVLEATEAKLAAAKQALAAAAGSATSVLDPAAIAEHKRQRMKKMLEEAREEAAKYKGRRALGTLFSPLTFALGGKVRFLLGCALIVGCAMWAKQNGIFSGEQIQQLGSAAVESVQNKSVTGLTEGVTSQVAAQTQAGASKWQPLSWPLVGAYFNSFLPGVAGLLLVLLGLFRGWKMSIFALPAAAILVLGIPGGPWATLGAGLALGLAGFFLGRTRGD